jgi:hypothetical protein
MLYFKAMLNKLKVKGKEYLYLYIFKHHMLLILIVGRRAIWSFESLWLEEEEIEGIWGFFPSLHVASIWKVVMWS